MFPPVFFLQNRKGNTENYTKTFAFVVCSSRFLLSPQSNVFRSSRPEMFCKKGVLKIFAKLAGKKLCQGFFFTEAAGCGEQLNLKKLKKVFLCEFCKKKTVPVTDIDIT